MSIQGFYLLPHPPIAIPEIGKGEERKISDTTNSYHVVGKEIAEKAPTTIIVITPHGFMFSDAVALSYEDEITGDLSNFRAPEVRMNLNINKKLTNKIYELAYGEGIPCGLVTKELLSSHRIPYNLDHGAMVPLYFVNQHYNNYNLVHITYGPINDIELYRFGMQITNAVNEFDENVVLIASGDLSHKLKEEGPYGFDPAGEKFDTEFLKLLGKGDTLGTLSIDKKIVCSAGECGRRSIAIMLGALEGKKYNGDLLSYQGTFGVGYGIMRFNVIGEVEPLLEKLEELRSAEYNRKSNQKDTYVRLARESLTTFLNEGKRLKDIPDYVSNEMLSAQNGVFVSLKKNGELRGCIGTFLPTTNNVAEEIIRNAVEAGTEDPRFYEVEPDELMDIDFSVDVLTKPESAKREELNPKIYGVIVRNGRRAGLLLPDLDGVDSVEQQLSIALQKAGIGEHEDFLIEKFKVIRHKED